MQWALGIMMYQMLSGHLPFWNAQSDRSPFAVMSAILNAEVCTACQSTAQSHTFRAPYCLQSAGVLRVTHARYCLLLQVYTAMSPTCTACATSAWRHDECTC